MVAYFLTCGRQSEATASTEILCLGVLLSKVHWIELRSAEVDAKIIGVVPNKCELDFKAGRSYGFTRQILLTKLVFPTIYQKQGKEAIRTSSSLPGEGRLCERMRKSPARN